MHRIHVRPHEQELLRLHEIRSAKPLVIGPRVRLTESIRDLDMPGFRFHALKGFAPRRYSMRVTANWRVTFAFVEGAAEAIELEDYHGA